jgi:DNA adenine methylase
MNNKPREFRPPVRWHGGKWKIALWVNQHLPRHSGYGEVFGGGASVLLRKSRAKAELYNDLDKTIVQLFRVLQDEAQAARLVRALALTPFARDEFDLAYEPHPDPVETARRTVVRSFMGYGSDGTAGVYKTGFRRNVSSSLKLPAQEWATYPVALWKTIERLSGVVIENRDAFQLLGEVDDPEWLHYVDPPYLPETRSQGNRRRGAGYHVYEHELTLEQHVELLALLDSLRGMVVLSGYPSDLYEQALPHWRRVERVAHADGGSPRTEVLWINPRAADRLAEGRLI